MGLDCNNMSVWRGGKLYCAGNRSTRRIRCTSKRHVKRERQSIMVLVIIRPLLKPYCTFLIDIYLHIPKTLTREREREREMTIFKDILHTFVNRLILELPEDERERERERERDMSIFKDILHTFVIDLYLHCPKTRERVTKSMTCPIFMIQTMTSHVLVSFWPSCFISVINIDLIPGYKIN